MISHEIRQVYKQPLRQIEGFIQFNEKTHIAADAYYTKNVFIDLLTDNEFHMVDKFTSF